MLAHSCSVPTAALLPCGTCRYWWRLRLTCHPGKHHAWRQISLMHACDCKQSVNIILQGDDYQHATFNRPHGTCVHRNYRAASKPPPAIGPRASIYRATSPMHASTAGPATYLAGKKMIGSQHLCMGPLQLHLLQHMRGFRLQKLHRLAECPWLEMQRAAQPGCRHTRN